MTIHAAREAPLVFTVSELNARIKSQLETHFGLVWVMGEISTLRVPSSGHHYFTLKDEESQIRAVLFRQQSRRLKFEPEAGLQVMCQGRISVYEPRGEYQLIVEVMEPQGLGALQLAFEQLKKRLEAEGLFDDARKKQMPSIPRRVAVVTSSTGAAIRDILKVLGRSPYPIDVTLLPVRVQGAEAAGEIAGALATISRLSDDFGWDVVIFGRGGGSLEDLWPFNEEVVARAAAACVVPTISAVGHEIDFTISDFVADLRVATPTAAAEWVVGRLERVERDLAAAREALERGITRRLDAWRQRLHLTRARLADPGRRLADLKLRVDDRLERIWNAFRRHLERLATARSHLNQRLLLLHPARRIGEANVALERLERELVLQAEKALHARRSQLENLAGRLESLSPLAVLGRGYSIVYRLPEKKVLLSAADTAAGEELLIQLAEGSIECTVSAVKERL